MNIGKSRKTSDLAALDGATFGLDKAMTLVSFVLLFVIVFIPIFMIVYNAFFFEGRFDIEMFQTVVFSKDNVDAMTNTVIIGFAVTIFGTIVGLFYAWLLGRSDIPCKGLMRALFMIPYMFPPFFGAMAWDMLLSGRGGYVNTWLMNTFGFETARAFATTEIENLMEDARTSNNRWYFTIAMGRTAGHLALGMGRSAGAAITIIPEEFPQDKIPMQQVVDIITGSIVKRYLTGKNYGVAVIAEGVIEKIAPEDFSSLGEVVTDEHGHIRYSELDFGEILKQAVLKEIKKLGLNISIIDKEIGYELRCAPPIAYDIDYARSLGYEAAQFLMRGDTGALITIQDNKAVPMRFEDIRDPETGKTKVRRVNIESVHYKIARGFMMRVEKEDLDDPRLANAFKMERQEFKDRYSYLFEN